jgi:hypothetical protein
LLEVLQAKALSSPGTVKLRKRTFGQSTLAQSTVGSDWSPTMITGKQIRRMMTGALLVFNAITYFSSFFQFISLFSGDRSLRELGPKRLNSSSILSSVLTVWPVFNKHTDLTAIYNPSTNFSQTMWWSD